MAAGSRAQLVERRQRLLDRAQAVMARKKTAAGPPPEDPPPEPPS